jgi:hypothetical protein
MAGKNKQGYFGNHAKSSAALVSLGIHAVLIVVALSFVAVSVIQKEDAVFEAKPVKRPKMQLKKLQVPVNIKKKKMKKPKLRKRIVVKPKMNQKMPDIKMPEITGVKGGLGTGAGGSLGGAGGVAFTMPNLNVFGVKSKGEKIFIMLDASNEMMYDEMGGIPAYTIIKQELVSILEGLPSTALFNVAVFDKWKTYQIYPQLMPASASNISKVEAWLKPLNAVRPGMGANEWGTRTLGSGGSQSEADFITGKFQRMESWHRPTMLAMQQQADAVFVLTSWWGYQRYAMEDRDTTWYETAAGKRYIEKAKEALKKYDQECRDRIAKGESPRVLNRHDKRLLVRTYFPDTARPPEPDFYYHKPEEYIKPMLALREKHKPKTTPLKSGLRSKKSGRAPFTFNVIRFMRTGEGLGKSQENRTVSNFKKMTGNFKGNYREIMGLEAIKSSVQ